MADKLQSKVKLRSGEVVTINHVKPSKTTPKDETKTTKKPDEKPKSDETKTPNTNETNEKPKETK